MNAIEFSAPTRFSGAHPWWWSISRGTLWERRSDVPLSFGMRACCSVPIVGRGGQILGIFTIYYRDPHRPSREESSLIQRVVDLAAIAISQRQSETKIHEAEERHRQYMDSIPGIVYTADAGAAGAWQYVKSRHREDPRLHPGRVDGRPRPVGQTAPPRGPRAGP